MFARPLQTAASAPRRISAAGLLRRLLAWREDALQRARLRQLDDHLLDDIGLTRAQAEAEPPPSFWEPPAHWRGR